MTVGEFMLFGFNDIPCKRRNNDNSEFMLFHKLSDTFEWNPVKESLYTQGKFYNIMLVFDAERFGINPYR